MNKLVEISFFPSMYFENLENKIDDVEYIIKNKEKIKEKILSEYSVSFLYDLYEKEKKEIKDKNYKLISSIIGYSDIVPKILEKYSIRSIIGIDLILKNKTNIFIDKNFNNEELIFIIKSISIMEFLSIRNLSGFKFNIFELKKSDNNVKNRIILNKLKNEIHKLNLECDIFLLSDGFFSLDKKNIDYLLLKSKVLE